MLQPSSVIRMSPTVNIIYSSVDTSIKFLFINCIGAWFKFLSKSGGRITVKNLQDGNEGAYFSVYDDSCSNLVKGGNEKDFYFYARKSAVYRIYATGNFVLGRNGDDYDCHSAELIESFPFNYKGTTQGYPYIYSECTGNDAQGMWFKLVGNGKNYFISLSETQEVNSWESLIIAVFGTCSSGVPGNCLDSIKSTDPLGATLILNAEKGSTYNIFVGVHSLDIGLNFTLSVVLYDSDDNSQCEAGTLVPKLPYSFSGTTRNKDISNISCHGELERKGVWFNYKNMDLKNLTGKTVLVSTCDHRMNMLKADIEIYQGCESDLCMATGPYDSRLGCTSVIFNAKFGVKYDIFVTSTDMNDTGDYYHVDFLELDSDSHENRSSPARCSSLPCAILGHTIGAKYTMDKCNNEYRPGYWVRVFGTGKPLYATTKGEKTSYPTSISVYLLNPSTSCLAKSNYSSSIHTSVTWNTIVGIPYDIFISGNNATTGIFTLKISEAAPPKNSNCIGPHLMRDIPSSEYSSTIFTNYTTSECRPGNPRKGTWYLVPGNSHYIRASTCDIMTDFGTRIEVYTGCDSEGIGGVMCVETTRDGSCGSKDIVVFRASRGKHYWIFVTASEDSESDSGFFSLRVIPENYFFELTKPITYYVFIGYLIIFALFSFIGIITALVTFIYAKVRRSRNGYLKVVKM